MQSSQRKRDIRRLVLQICCISLVLAVSLTYFLRAPNSAAWLHTEDFSRSDFEIGSIKFRFYNDTEMTAIQSLSVNVIAPTRYFIPLITDDTEGIDENFNMVARSHAVTGTNVGSAAIRMDLSYTETVESPQKIYFLFVPIENTANYLNNYVNRNYRQYLDTALQGKPVATQAQREASIRQLNEENILKMKSISLSINQTRTLCYLLVWAEYDLVNWGTKLNAEYVQQRLPLVLNAYCYQEYKP